MMGMDSTPLEFKEVDPQRKGSVKALIKPTIPISYADS